MTEENYSPKAVTGVPFDDLMSKVAKMKPPKKKKAPPNKARGSK